MINQNLNNFAKFCLFSIIIFEFSNGEKAEMPKVTNLQLGEEEAFRLYQHWTDQALASLMSAFLQTKLNGNELASKLPDKFAECYLESRKVPEMAKCVCGLLRGDFEGKKGPTMRLKKYRKKKEKRTKMNWIGQFKIGNGKIGRQKGQKGVEKAANSLGRILKLKLKRKRLKRSGEEEMTEKVEHRGEYELMDAKKWSGLSPIGGLARILMANELGRKNKKEKRPWQKAVFEIKKLQKMRNEFLDGNQIWKEKSKNWKDGNEAGIGGRREKPIDEQISDLVRQGIRLGMKLARQKGNGTEGADEEGEGEGDRREKDEGRTVEVLSPRFLSVTERKKGKKSAIYSPSLFSLHRNGEGMEGKMSLPNLMKGSKLTGRDQQEWLDLILEASGVNQRVDEAKEYLEGNKEDERRYKEQFKGLYLTRENVKNMFGEFEDRKIETWEKLGKEFTKEQRNEMGSIGYSLMNKAQMVLIYGPKSPFNDSEALARLLPFIEGNNKTGINQIIEADIRRMAEMGSFDVRKKDIVLSPALFNPTIANSNSASQSLILSPVVFSPTIRSPTIFGPAILSPSVFSPGILSPRLMSPLVLSPFIFSTLVLSPIVMQPYILSPGAINGVILSPFVMDPVILSPQLMHPFILSPFVMTPGILSPTLLSPLVLSPFIMNPQIFSPKAFAGLFLSPYSLSPVFSSPVYFYYVVLSPSVLS